MKKVNISEIEELTIVVDMVNGFVKGGIMADPYIKHIIPIVRAIMEDSLNSDNQAVVVIKENHDENAQEFKVHSPHCIKNTREADLISELSDLEPFCYEFFKNSTSAIWATGFIDFIKEIVKNPKLKKVKIVGCCTDICVFDVAIPLKKLFDELNIEAEVVIPEDAVETYQIKPHIYDNYGRIIEQGVHDRNEWNNMAFRFLTQAGIKITNSQDMVKLDKLKEVLMGYPQIPTNYYSIGTEQEQTVCIVKEDGIWKVFNVEKGNHYNKILFYDFMLAAKELINRLVLSQELMQEIFEDLNNSMNLKSGYQKTLINKNDK